MRFAKCYLPKILHSLLLHYNFVISTFQKYNFAEEKFGRVELKRADLETFPNYKLRSNNQRVRQT